MVHQVLLVPQVPRELQGQPVHKVLLAQWVLLVLPEVVAEVAVA
jgi:hypothetical protein